MHCQPECRKAVVSPCNRSLHYIHHYYDVMTVVTTVSVVSEVPGVSMVSEVPGVSMVSEVP